MFKLISREKYHNMITLRKKKILVYIFSSHILSIVYGGVTVRFDLKSFP